MVSNETSRFSLCAGSGRCTIEPRNTWCSSCSTDDRSNKNARCPKLVSTTSDGVRMPTVGYNVLLGLRKSRNATPSRRPFLV